MQSKLFLNYYSIDELKFSSSIVVNNTFRNFFWSVFRFRSVHVAKLLDISNLCNDTVYICLFLLATQRRFRNMLPPFALDQLPIGEFIGWTKRTFRTVAKLGERIKIGSQSEKHSKRSFYDDCSHNVYVIYGFRSKSLQQIVKILAKIFEWRERPRHFFFFSNRWNSCGI